MPALFDWSQSTMDSTAALQVTLKCWNSLSALSLPWGGGGGGLVSVHSLAAAGWGDFPLEWNGGMTNAASEALTDTAVLIHTPPPPPHTHTHTHPPPPSLSTRFPWFTSQIFVI